MNNIINRRRAYSDKLKPKDVVTVYSFIKDIAAGSGKSATIWFTFKSNAIYEIDATITNVSSQWRIDFLGGNPTIISGNKNNWSGGRILFTFKFTSTPANRFNVYVASSSGATTTVKLIETIPASN